MKAVVLDSTRSLVLEEHDVPVAGPGEVLIRSEYCGICGTDLHASEIDMFRPPVVMGHEFAGVIAALGSDVDGWNVGDKVTINPNENVCGTCEYCRAGRYNLCHTAIFENSLGVRRNGGMAEYVAVPVAHLHKLPDSLDTRAGAWAEPLAVAVRAVRNSDIRMGERTAVIGGGPIGLLVLQLLRIAGAAEVLLVEPSEFRRKTALALGADAVFTADELSAALASDDFDPVHRVYECSGHPAALQSAVNMLAAGGEVRLIGASPKPLTVDAMSLLAKEITITSNFIYVDEFEIAVDLLAKGRIKVDELTSEVVPLERFADAFAALRQPDRTIKVLLQCQPDA